MERVNDVRGMADVMDRVPENGRGSEPQSTSR